MLPKVTVSRVEQAVGAAGVGVAIGSDHRQLDACAVLVREYVQRVVHTRIPRSTTDEDRKQGPQAEVHLRQRRAVMNEHEAIAVGLTDVGAP
jgi:hypothetical protein